MNAIFLLHNKSMVEYVYDDNTLRQGLKKMRAHGYTAIPVITREGIYIGCISEGDFLWHIVDCSEPDRKALADTPIREIIRPNWNPAVGVSVTMDELLERAMRQNFVPIVDDRNTFIGIITRRDIIGYFMNNQNVPEQTPLSK